MKLIIYIKKVAVAEKVINLFQNDLADTYKYFASFFFYHKISNGVINY